MRVIEIDAEYGGGSVIELEADYGDCSYGGVFYRTWVFDPYMSDDEIATALWNAGFNPDGAYCTHSYDCCARWYPNPIRIVRGILATYVTQTTIQNV
jgi:hypothetical protein